MTNIKEWFRSIDLKKSIWVLVIFITALALFRAGMFVGYRKASYSYNFGERYYQAFGPMGYKMDGPQLIKGMGNPMMRGIREDFPSPHGTNGKIIKISSANIIIECPDGMEKIITVKDDTLIRRQREEIKITDLKANDQIIVIGAPNEQAEIVAKLIRVMPAAN